VPLPGVPEQAAKIVQSERSQGQVTGQEFSYGGEQGRIESIVVMDAKGTPKTTFNTGDQARIEMMLAAGEDDLEETIFAMVVKDSRGLEVYGTNTYFQGIPTPTIPAGSRFRVTFDLPLNVMSGVYFLSLGWTRFENTELKVVHRRYDVIRLDVLPIDRSIGIANCFAKIGFEQVG
jgi:lipopolysaccharide transport system ATP-binding protein